VCLCSVYEEAWSSELYSLDIAHVKPTLKICVVVYATIIKEKPQCILLQYIMVMGITHEEQLFITR
jgi:hypothetical protein